MGSTTDRGDDPLYRHVPALIVGGVFAVAVALGVARGGATAVLWLAFASLAGAVLLFWEALRHALDPSLPGDEALTDEGGASVEAEAKKREALRALKDIAFERSIGRLGEDDYKALEARYRAEARDAMRAVDEGLGPWLAKAEAQLATIEAGEATPEVKPEASVVEPAAETPTETTRACPKCATTNDPDAVFCKKCGSRMVIEAEASDA